MSDAYGNLVLSFSEDFDGNKLALCAALNEVNYTGWCSGGGEFVEKEGIIYFKPADEPTQYPTVFAERLTGYLRYENAEFVQFVSVEEMREEDGEIYNDWESQAEVISLAELCSMLSEHITKGSLSLSACAIQKGFHHYFENLSVNSDGGGERFRYSAHLGHAPQNFVEKC